MGYGALGASAGRAVQDPCLAIFDGGRERSKGRWESPNFIPLNFLKCNARDFCICESRASCCTDVFRGPQNGSGVCLGPELPKVLCFQSLLWPNQANQGSRPLRTHTHTHTPFVLSSFGNKHRSREGPGVPRGRAKPSCDAQRLGGQHHEKGCLERKAPLGQDYSGHACSWKKEETTPKRAKLTEAHKD